MMKLILKFKELELIWYQNFVWTKFISILKFRTKNYIYIFFFLFNKLYLLFFFLICQLNAPGGGGGGGVTDPVEVEPATPLYALLKSLWDNYINYGALCTTF